jgi:hypothetical protein
MNIIFLSILWDWCILIIQLRIEEYNIKMDYKDIFNEADLDWIRTAQVIIQWQAVMKFSAP